MTQLKLRFSPRAILEWEFGRSQCLGSRLMPPNYSHVRILIDCLRFIAIALLNGFIEHNTSIRRMLELVMVIATPRYAFM